MNIWIINPYAVPPTLGGLNRHYFFKKYLEEYGHSVTVFSSSSIYNRQYNLFEKKEKGLYKVKMFDGLDFVYVKTPDGRNIISRLLAIHTFCERLKKISKKNFFEKPDVVYVSVSPEIEIGILGNYLAREFDCPSIIELRDLYPDTLVSLKRIKESNLLYKIMSHSFKKTLCRADGLVFTMDGGKKYISDKKWDISNGGKIDLNSVYIINNGVDLASFDILKNNNYTDRDLDNPEFKNIVYTGSMGIANDLDRLLAIAKECHFEKVRFILWGDGKTKKHLIERINNEKINNVIIKDPVDGKCIPNIIEKSFATVMIQKDIKCDAKYGISSNKSFQYMAAGRPIILLANAPFDLFDRYKPGLQLKENDPHKNATDINNFIFNMHDDILYHQCCCNAREMAKNYDYKSISHKFEKAIEEILTNFKTKKGKS